MSILKGESQESGSEKSLEEIKAEEVMRDDQKELSEQREKMIEGLRAMGKEGYIEIEINSSNEGGMFTGDISGHNLEISYIPENEEQIFFGKVDGTTINPEIAQKLWVKYSGIAVDRTLNTRVGNKNIDEIASQAARDREAIIVKDLL
ncbi:MAG: hypothetical protein WC242_02710 [Candidatus Paceibacterota bacterium]|jgi:hypothetical protein